jgi:signal transduction histidine kinase
MQPNQKNYNILVIEDNPGDYALVEDLLKEHIPVPEIVNATTFKGAKLFLTNKTIACDVILLDLGLPDGDGEALIAEIIALCPECPVIVLTGYADLDFSIKSLSLGIADYLLKDDINATSLYKSILYSIERKKSIIALKESETRYSNLKVDEQKRIARAVISAQEKERAGIGAELHDNVTQLLAASKLYLKGIEAQPENAHKFLLKCEEYIGTALQEIRKLSHALVGASRDKDIWLISSIDELTHDITSAKQIDVRFIHDAYHEDDMNEELKLVIYRIIQEQLNNILKHAEASKVEIELKEDAADLILSISDDGKGFDTIAKRHGIGLKNIKNRAGLYNGKVDIISSPGNGCKISIYFKESAIKETGLQSILA